MKKIYSKYAQVEPFVRYIARGDFQNENNLEMNWRSLFDFELIFVLEGTIYVEEKDVKYRLTPHDVHIMPPDVLHRRYTKKNETFSYWNIHFEFIQGNFHPVFFDVRHIYVDTLQKNIFEKEETLKLQERSIIMLEEDILPRKTKIKDPYFLISCLERMCLEISKETSINRNKQKGLMMYILAEIINQNTKNLDVVEHIEDIIKIFKENIEYQILNQKTVKDFIHNLGYSYDHFRKVFKKIEGVSPQQFIINKKIEMAENYLKLGYFIREIVDILGFSCESYFSMCYKKIKGYSPIKDKVLR